MGDEITRPYGVYGVVSNKGTYQEKFPLIWMDGYRLYLPISPRRVLL